MPTATIFLCDAQPIVFHGLGAVLGNCEDLRLSGHATDVRDAGPELVRSKPDVILLGQALTNRSVLPALTFTRETLAATQVVLWVAELSEVDSFRALQLGVRGILKKTSSAGQILECLRTVAQGGVWIESSLCGAVQPGARSNNLRITPREREIVEHICRGMKNKDIAEALSITPGTVKVHLMHVFEKTGLKDRFQLALQGRQLLGLDAPIRTPVVAQHATVEASR